MAVPVQHSTLAHPLPAPIPGSPFESEEYKSVEAYLQGFASQPKPGKWQDWWQWEMSRIHLLVLSMLDRTYRFAEYAVEKDDVLNYLSYAEISVAQIYHHHALEEEKIFPVFAKAAEEDLWAANLEEHHAFAPALDALWLYLHNCRLHSYPDAKSPFPTLPSEVSSTELSAFPTLPAEPTTFDPKVLRRHIDSFVLVLAQHLGDELGTLEPRNMDKVGEREDEKVRAAVLGHLKGYDPAWFLCAAMTCLPIEDIKKAMPLPWIVRRVLVPFVFGGKHAGAWRYAPNPENLTWTGSA